MSELIITKYNSYVEIPKGETPYLKSTICQDLTYPEFRNYQGQFNNQRIYLYGSGLDSLIETAVPKIKNDNQWHRFFANTKQWRNRLYHQGKRTHFFTF